MGETQLSLQLFDISEQTLANFYPADNVQAVDFIRKLCEPNPRNLQIYLWGNPQSGRSHLLQAICAECAKFRLSAIYLPLKQLLNYDPSLLQNLEQYDLISFDDIDLLTGKSLWQEEVFHLFNRSFEQNTRLLFTSNCAPRELNFGLKDLTSRLNLGLVFRLNDLSDEDKLQALKLRANKLGMQLSNEVGQFIINHTSRNMSFLLQILAKLDRISLQEQRRLTIPLVKQVLNDVKKGG